MRQKHPKLFILQKYAEMCAYSTDIAVERSVTLIFTLI